MTILRFSCLLVLASCAAANPFPKPTPPPLDPEGRDRYQPMGSCTTTTTSFYRGFTGDWAPSKKITRYTSTETVKASIDCHGCRDVHVEYTLGPDYGGIGPVVPFVDTVWATTPSRVTELACATSAANRRVGPPVPILPPPPREKREQPGSCTKTMTTRQKPWWVEGPGEGVLTVHATTAIRLEEVDCGGCALELETLAPVTWGGLGPVVIYTSTVTVAAPATITSTMCKPTAAPASPIPFPPAQHQESDDDKGCTYTQIVANRYTFGPVYTVWPETVTSTEEVYCGEGCRHVTTSSLRLGPGPVVHFTTTVTATEPRTTTVYRCAEPTKPQSPAKRAEDPEKTRPVPEEHTAIRTETVYVATKTIAHTTDCTNSKTGLPNPPPEAPLKQRGDPDKATTVYATKTVTRLRCRPTGPAREQEGPIGPESAKKIATPAGNPSPTCTSSTIVWPPIPNSTWTVYAATKTQTSTVDCKDCALSWSTGTVYFFAPMIYTKTETVKTATTETAFACKETSA